MTDEPEPAADSADQKTAAAPSRRTLTELPEISSEPLYSVTDDGRFEVVNEAFVALTGYERSELLGRDANSIVPDEDSDEWNRRVQLLSQEETVESDGWVGRLISKNGTVVPVEWKFRIRDDMTGIVGRARDLREGRHKEQKLSVLNRALRHNIRNQMNVIIAKSTTLQEIDDEGYRTAAAKIEEIGQNIVTISDKARKAQEHIGIVPDAKCQVDLSTVPSSVMRKFSIRYPDVSIELDVPEQAQARAPPSVDTALMELVENAAIHHETGAGPVRIEVDEADGLYRLSVIDECEQIPDPVIDTLSRGSEEPLKHNQGIGLWIVRWVVDAVDGALSFERRPDGEGNVVAMSFERLD